jgi:hypothetical protein
MDWKEFLPGLAPREDLDDPFGADSFELEQPALLNKSSVLTAAAVAARLLEMVALRGGTRVKPSSAQALRRLVQRVLPEPAVNLCEDEAGRTLRWLTEAEPYGGGPAPPEPEVGIVFEADIDSRIQVARFAIAEGYDLELEYLDADQNIWPRLRCTPQDIEDAPGDDAVPILEVESDFGHHDIPLDHIRWMMPVSSHEHRRATGRQKPAGKLLQFPGDNGEE